MGCDGGRKFDDLFRAGPAMQHDRALREEEASMTGGGEMEMLSGSRPGQTGLKHAAICPNGNRCIRY